MRADRGLVLLFLGLGGGGGEWVCFRLFFLWAETVAVMGLVQMKGETETQSDQTQSVTAPPSRGRSGVSRDDRGEGDRGRPAGFGERADRERGRHGLPLHAELSTASPSLSRRARLVFPPRIPVTAKIRRAFPPSARAERKTEPAPKSGRIDPPLRNAGHA